MVRPVSGKIEPRDQPVSPHRGAKLTSDQKSAAREIISRFNPHNIAREDKEALREELLNAGIDPGEDLKEIFEESAFEVGSRKKPPGRPPRRGFLRPPPRAASLSHDARGHLMNFLEKHEDGNITREDVDALSLTLRGEGAPTTGWLIDIEL